MNEIFSGERLWLLLRRDVIDGYRSLLTISAALTGIIFVTAMIATDGSEVGRSFYLSWFGALLFLWGIFATSRAFRELHDKTRNEAYLLLPASEVEKTVARLLMVTVGLVGFLLVFVGIASLLVEGVRLLLIGERNAYFDPLDPRVWNLIPGYLFFQSMYFLGATWFRKAHLVKTTLALMLICVFLAAFTMLVVRIVFAPYWGDGIFAAELLYQSYENVIEGTRVGLQLLLPILCWSVAWMRVRETQVSDGV